MKIKEYPDKRICTIDFYPLLEQATKEVLTACKRYNIPLNTTGRGSTDVSRFFYHFCLEKFLEGYKSCNSKYPKVLVFYPITNGVLKNFVDKGLDKVLKILPVPWCKVKKFDSPDTSTAALGAIEKNRNVAQNLDKFARSNELFSFLKKKYKVFLNGTVDLTEDPQ